VVYVAAVAAVLAAVVLVTLQVLKAETAVQDQMPIPLGLALFPL
jgi:hypothetical protein